MTVVDALTQTELNALADLMRRLDELDYWIAHARTHIDKAQTPSGRRVVWKAEAVSEAIEIWAAARHAVLKAEALQCEGERVRRMPG